MVGTYRCKRKVNRWPVALFCNMLDISALNAFIIYTQMNPMWNFTKKTFRRRLFLIEIANYLVEPYIQQRRTLPRGANAFSIVNQIQGNSTDELSNESQEASIFGLGLRHTTLSNKRARCHLCLKLQNSNVHSVRCDKCNRNICPSHRFILCK